MPLNLPRRETSAAKVGPRLDVSPLEIKAQLENEHGLSNLICSASTWEPFAWKGNDLSAPMRALWVAESRGLLRKRGDRFEEVFISNITADINEYLMSFNKQPVSENSVLGNLRKASLYVNASVGVSIIPDRKAMSLRIADGVETEQNLKRYFDKAQVQLIKAAKDMQHAKAMNFDISHQIAAVEEATGLRLLLPTREADAS